jgi:hypothetical protein
MISTLASSSAAKDSHASQKASRDDHLDGASRDVADRLGEGEGDGARAHLRPRRGSMNGEGASSITFW